MKNVVIRNTTTLRVNKSLEGERIEQKIERIVTQKEPIKDGAPLIYTDRKDGVRPEYDIRTDRFEIAVEAMDVANKAKVAQRDNKPKNEEKKVEIIDKVESIQATE